MSELADLLRQLVDHRLGGVHVSVPGQIKSYDATKQRCSVQPMAHQRHGTAEVALPLLSDVPVVFPRGGGVSISWPLAVNDVVEVRFSDRMLDGWRTTGTNAEPTDPRAHALADAFVVPAGIWPDATPSSSPSATDIVIAFDSGAASIRVTPAGQVVLGGVGATKVALAPALATTLLPVLTSLASALTATAASAAALSAIAANAIAAPATVASTAAAVAAAASVSSLSSSWPTAIQATKVSAL